MNFRALVVPGSLTAQMSDAFFRDLVAELTVLGVGSGSPPHNRRRMQLFGRRAPEASRLGLVVADVNSTLACALVCAKLLVPVAHSRRV